MAVIDKNMYETLKGCYDTVCKELCTGCGSIRAGRVAGKSKDGIIGRGEGI